MTAPSTARHSEGSSRTQFVSADRLFADLDGRSLNVRQATFLLTVLGVVDDQSGCRWVQVALSGPPVPPRMITIKIEHGAGARQAMTTLAAELSSVLERPELSASL
jgi:hypothetical protein